MRTFTDLADLVAAKGEHLGYSGWHTVTQESIDTFADATGDHQWIHVDRDKAAAGPFGGTIAHGFLTLSLLSAFSPQVWRLEKQPTMTINYGLNRVRFLQPVRSGARVRDGVELTDVRETKSGTLLTFQHTVEIEGEERNALAAEGLSLVVP
ncbi:MaoC family dehydratase [Streptomonospora wellingtoniae]|uniref:MaoC family dehydratase n=1 Tax=Streptomonospora wellingtoniae TaxID=3075544 RepID=A0ABU2KNX9_9ACTN|nr:MaoC family dehydratase [Streptomonospora sp. DSM 45055]MDT0300975.1 MaoC family dehydratase [Streptomonospora sp. DSM 45055]